jgi:hypothetical protein
VAFHLEFLSVFEATFETDKWSTPEAKAGSVDEDPSQRTKCPGTVPSKALNIKSLNRHLYQR